jgi:hypothetical protein
MSTLASLMKDMRLQLRRYGASTQINPDEARWYVNLAYTYYLMRLGAHKETDLVSRLAAIDLEESIAIYAIPDSLVNVTAVIINYEGAEYYLYRHEPKSGVVPVGVGGVGGWMTSWFEGGWFSTDTPAIVGDWMPVAQFQGRTLRLLPAPPLDIAAGLIFEGTIFPTLLVEATDPISNVLPVVYHPLIVLKSAVLALADSKQPVDAAESALSDMEAMFDVLSSNRTQMREIVEDASY